MGDMVEAFKAFKEYKKEVRAGKEPDRIAYAKSKLVYFNIIEESDSLIINLKKGKVVFYPFTGWFQGQKPYGKIKGRGIFNLLKALKEAGVGPIVIKNPVGIGGGEDK